MVWLIDGHEDLAWNALTLGRDETAPLASIRHAEGAVPAHGEGVATVSLPTLRAVDVRVVLATLFAYPQQGARRGYRTPEEAHQQALAQLTYYEQLHACGEATLVRSRADLEGVIAQELPAPGLVLLMEGADPLRTPADLELFYDRGLRIIGPAWKATRYAGAAGQPGPLTTAGRELLGEMAVRGMALDISHLAEAAYEDALAIFPGLLIASHANCRALVPGERQLSDAQIRAIAARDGVIGLVFYNRFLRAGWRQDDGKAAVTLDDVAAHATHIAELVGPRHVALGTDLDGGVGREVTPAEIDSIIDLPHIADALHAAGFDEDAVTGILHANWLRVLRAMWGEELGGRS